MFKINLRKIGSIFGACLVAIIFFIFVVNYFEIKSGSEFVYRDAGLIGTSEVAIIFGAKVRDEQMSPIFEDRVVSALDLYKAGKVKKILVSGDHGRTEYDEVNVAKDFLASNGVDANDIFTDYAGFDTYDTLYRAKEIFSVESAILVTQEFHLYRAIYIAQNIKMNAIGYSADLHNYRGSEIYNAREVLARVKAYFDVMFNSKPKYLGDEIPISGDGRKSWDQ